MGWNSWNKFARRVSDQVVRQTADAIVKNGMKDAGYIYVNIDDAWQGTRDAEGNIRPNEKFPDMKALADYIHSKGLKIGIYSSPGPKTCANYEGSFQHEEQDAKTFAAWGIDYIKYDWCSASQVYDYHSMQAVYAKMGTRFARFRPADRLQPLSIWCSQERAWGAKVGGNSWRTTGDIRDRWESMSHIGFDQQLELAPYAGPGHWNDPDMLEIGNGGMTTTEYRTHMSLWSLLAAPLLAGNDRTPLRRILCKSCSTKKSSPSTRILSERSQASFKRRESEVWARPLKGGRTPLVYSTAAPHRPK